MAYICSKDPSHQSDDPDYCSICGAKITGAPSALAAPVAAPISTASQPASGEVCPDCSTPRHPGARFCEICRYNFETGSSGSVAAVTVAPDPALVPLLDPQVLVQAAPDPASITPDINAAQPAPADVAIPVAAGRWEAVVRVDATLYADPDPAVPCPVGEPEHMFPLDLAESLIGRRSDRLDIHPEIPLTDPGVSHRHAKVYRLPDGTLALLDVGSTNGTQVNGADLAAGVRLPLNEGDEVTLGCWTRIVIRSATA